MADDEVATKAPESDAVEESDAAVKTATKASETDADNSATPRGDDVVEASPIPNDSKAQEGPAMGEHCTTDRPTPAGMAPTGEMTKIADVDAYVTKPADYPHSPSKLLLFLTGGTGLHSTNNQIQADKFAEAGFLVVMPDMFAGDAAPNTATTEAVPQERSLLERFKLGVAETAKSLLIDMWLARQTPEKVLPIIHRVLKGAKEEFADAVASGSGVYGVGYCFGAKYILILAGERPDTVSYGLPAAEKDGEPDAAGSGPFLKAGAIAHGTMVTRQDVTSVKAPVYMACVEHDQLFPDEVRIAGKQHLEKEGVEHEVQLFPDVPHGFAVLGHYEDQKIIDAQADAFSHMLGWLQNH